MLHEMDGVPPLPMAIDDEYISDEHHFPQPANKRSYMTGFVILTRIFRLVGHCLQKHRTYVAAEGSTDAQSSLIWIEQASEELRSLLQGVPVDTAPASTSPNDEASWWGIQCANIHITALCAEFALVST